MACGGGLSTRTRTVLIPIRGNGKCPTETSYHRFNDKKCNTQDCVGDEICIAKQDLIFVLDGSGSLKDSGFAVLRQFAANLTTKYQGQYYGATDIALGVVLFGNGYLQSDGTIARAVKAQSITSDMAGVKARIEALTWQKGFTNLAQGFAAADTMLDQDGREDAQSAVLTIWDGRINFEFETKAQAHNLKDKNVWVFMEPIMESDSAKELHFMRSELASQPWQTNFYRIPGLDALSSNNALYIQESIAMFCPKAISPSVMKAKEDQRQYLLIREFSFPRWRCAGPWRWLGLVKNVDDCAAKARSYNMRGFQFGWRYPRWKKMNKKLCYGTQIPVTSANWVAWHNNKVNNDPCSAHGGLRKNPWWDTYVLKPQ
jgi:hypothetical protein